MSLTEESVIAGITVTETGIIEVRRADRILRDGALVAETYHRWTLEPGAELTGQDARVAAVAASVWTEEVVAAYAAAQAPVPSGDAE